MVSVFKKAFGVFFISSAIFSAAPALAASGACSGHGGVNCSAGADWDGSVICNDGWKKSSVSYKSMAMCAAKKSVPPSAAAPKKNSTSYAVPQKACCKVCTTGKACGNSCISARYACHKAPGCACNK